MITDPEWFVFLLLETESRRSSPLVLSSLDRAPNVRRWALDHQRFDSGAEGLLCGSWEIMTVGLLAMSIR